VLLEGKLVTAQVCAPRGSGWREPRPSREGGQGLGGQHLVPTGPDPHGSRAWPSHRRPALGSGRKPASPGDPARPALEQANRDQRGLRRARAGVRPRQLAGRTGVCTPGRPGPGRHRWRQGASEQKPAAERSAQKQSACAARSSSWNADLGAAQQGAVGRLSRLMRRLACPIDLDAGKPGRVAPPKGRNAMAIDSGQIHQHQGLVARRWP